MFERYLASYLNNFLGEYVEEDCFSKEKLTIGAWDGSIVLTDLKLKASALDVLNLPITLKKGIIGRLKLEVGDHDCWSACLFACQLDFLSPPISMNCSRPNKFEIDHPHGLICACVYAIADSVGSARYQTAHRCCRPRALVAGAKVRLECGRKAIPETHSEEGEACSG